MFVSDLDPSEKPINQNWSWDRILRSCFIKQADVLQGIYFFEEDYKIETIKANYDFYEPRTVHESSLSPCVHSILANMLGYEEDAYEFYLRTSRLDIDDYNNEVNEGLHITSMGGTWMSVVYGFGGLRVKDDMVHLNPHLPKQWKSLSFKVVFRENDLRIHINGTAITIDCLNSHGQHLGGLIAPGLQLMKQSLEQGTKDLSFSKNHYLAGLADSTESAIYTGTLYSAAGLIEKTINDLCPCQTIILTGGDAELLAKHMAIDSTIEPDIVLKGLSLFCRREER